MFREIADTLRCPKPTLTHYKRVTKYPDGGLMSLSLDTPAPPDEPRESNRRLLMPTPVLISYTPNSLRIGWPNPFPGAPPLDWSELQMSSHPRDWRTDCKTLRFKKKAMDAMYLSGNRLQTLLTNLKPDTRIFIRVRVCRLGASTKYCPC